MQRTNRIKVSFSDDELETIREMARDEGVMHNGAPAPSTFVSQVVRKLIKAHQEGK